MIKPTPKPNLRSQMVGRMIECGIMDGDTEVVPVSKPPDMALVFSGQLVHVMRRDGGKLYCTWIPKTWCCDVPWLFLAYGK